MANFYKIIDNKAQVGSGTPPDDTWVVYTVGEEPQDLAEALEVEAKEQELQAKLSEAKQYLNSTDWYYARKAETGEEVPQEVQDKRIEARKFIQDNAGGE